MFFASSSPHVSIVAEKIFTVFGIPVTNSMLLGLLGYGLIIGIMLWVANGVKNGTKNRFALAVQWGYEILVKMTEDVVGNKRIAKAISPLAVTIFFTVMVNNWLGVMPGVGSVLHNGAPLFRGLAADLNFTFALAAVTIVTVQVYAARELGALGNIKRYIINPLKSPIGAFEGILELVGEFSRFVALSMRLFGNVLGGEVLLSVISALSGWFAVLPLPFLMAFELFVGALQAYVFYMLTIIFVSLAIAHHGSDSSHSQGEASATVAMGK